MTPEEEQQRRREQLFDGWAALKEACRKSHKGGPGGAAMCVCGANGGGSAACSMLGTLKNLIRYLPAEEMPPAMREHVEMLQGVIH